MKKFIIMVLLLCIGFNYNANAMGNREEGALIGAGALLFIGSLLSTHENNSVTYYNNYPSYTEREVVYYNTPTVVYEPYVERRVYIEDNRYERHYYNRGYYNRGYYNRGYYDRGYYDRGYDRHYDRNYYDRHH